MKKLAARRAKGRTEIKKTLGPVGIGVGKLNSLRPRLRGVPGTIRPPGSHTLDPSPTFRSRGRLLYFRRRRGEGGGRGGSAGC